MKSILLLAFVFSAGSVFAQATNDQLNSLVVDQVISSHQTKLSRAELKLLPVSIVCDTQAEITELKSVIKANKSKESAIVDLTDGDQVGGFLFMLSDLRDLKAKKVASVQALSYGGYWWADGDHYAFDSKAVTCSLK